MLSTKPYIQTLQTHALDSFPGTLDEPVSSLSALASSNTSTSKRALKVRNGQIERKKTSGMPTRRSNGQSSSIHAPRTTQDSTFALVGSPTDICRAKEVECG